ncbi:MAG: peptidoglycan editing factor PgeF [bacterium]
MKQQDIIHSNLFKNFPEIKFGFSTKQGGVSPEPFCMNLSNAVGDNTDNVNQNRKIFFDKLGIKSEQVTYQKQIHSAIINYSSQPTHFEGCDAIYTDRKNNFLAVSVADCIPIFLYAADKKIVAGIHSGWKGTEQKILSLTIDRLKNEYDINSEDLIAYVGPGICGEHYEVGSEVGSLFDENIRSARNGKYYLDLKKDNYNQMIAAGLRESNIEVSGLCTFEEKNLLHSYRRDGIKSGRMFGVIGLV